MRSRPVIISTNSTGATPYEPNHYDVVLRESSFNMTRGGDEDIETGSLKF